jgi:putative mRNA 3-end processing factor
MTAHQAIVDGPRGLLRLTPGGLFCPQGDFHIDPWRPVRRAVITHAHADHARRGSGSYLCSRDGAGLLRARLGDEAPIETLVYGEILRVNGVGLSLHPAGHVLGSAQVALTKSGYRCVVSGDYKTAPDPTCTPLEPQPCHAFISESTFGLPIFTWPPPESVAAQINRWWRRNRNQGRPSILFAYSLGKAQRILALVDPDIGPIFTHGAVEAVTRRYRDSGVVLPETRPAGDAAKKERFRNALVIAPPAADHPAWMRRFPDCSRAFASGWMRIRGNRRRRSVDRGFVLSDHSDWGGLVRTILATGAQRIGLTHGYAAEMARWLVENGLEAEVVPSEYPSEGGTA